jgi:hypothetical protein
MLLWKYKQLIEPPDLKPFVGYVLKVQGPIVSSSSAVQEYAERFHKAFQGFPINLPVRLIFLSREDERLLT